MSKTVVECAAQRNEHIARVNEQYDKWIAKEGHTPAQILEKKAIRDAKIARLYGQYDKCVANVKPKK